jgi:hypothetical protein
MVNRPIDPAVAIEMQRLRRDCCLSYNAIARILGLSYDGVRRNLDPEFKARRNESMLKSYSGPLLLGSGPIGSAGTPEDSRVPACVLAERDRRRTHEISIRCDVLGDPEPGRSALDRQREHRA